VGAVTEGRAGAAAASSATVRLETRVAIAGAGADIGDEGNPRTRAASRERGSTGKRRNICGAIPAL
jgi:hypothetical protein